MADGLLPVSLPSVRIALQPNISAGVLTAARTFPPATTDKDGRFVIGQLGEVMPGSYCFQVDVSGSQPTTAMSVQSVMAEAVDLLDTCLLIGPGHQTPTNLVVNLTTAPASLGGVLDPASARTPDEYTIIVFSQDRGFWRSPYRRVRAVRPARNGQYIFPDLPPGRYHVAALTELAPEEWRDPDLLAELVGGAVSIEVLRGERRQLDLRLGGRLSSSRRF